MAIQIENMFPTLVGRGTLPGAAALNRRLLAEIKTFSKQDKLGREWSAVNYRGGYTSYGSLSDMHYRAPAFAHFAELLQPVAEELARKLRWEMRGMRLEMNACWMNIMPKHTYHTLHLHPHSVLSGAYYVTAPKGSVSLKLEDPRMGFYMHAPVRPVYEEIRPKAGTFVLFESWLRHEVPPNQSNEPRISISFNYSLAADED